MTEKIQCQICGKWFQQINGMHLKSHNITLEEYKKKFPDAITYPLDMIEDAKIRGIKRYEDPEEREKERIKTTNNWNDPDYRENQIKIRNSDEFKNDQSRIVSQMWDEEKFSRTQTEDHKRKKNKAVSETKLSNPNRFGEYAGNWRGGLSFVDYPQEFSELLRTKIRDKYNNCDYMSGLHKSICNKNVNLDVHHIDYDKSNNSEDNLIPLSKHNHMRTNGDRLLWERLFKNSLGYEKDYGDDI